MRYEAMQRNIDAEVSALLAAIGAPRPHIAAASASDYSLVSRGGGQCCARSLPSEGSHDPRSQVKAGSDDMSKLLVNAHAIQKYLNVTVPLPCLHSMFVARGPVVFELGACVKELEVLLPKSMQAEMDAVRMSAVKMRKKLSLTASECLGLASP